MTFQVGRLTLRVHETPGHSPGHVVFEVQQTGGAIDLIVGDTLFALGCASLLYWPVFLILLLAPLLLLPRQWSALASAFRSVRRRWKG
jgi:glyoxylase-like metal-dependent hydrolase (beta-lactamase superfamily II)